LCGVQIYYNKKKVVEINLVIPSGCDIAGVYPGQV